MSSQKVTVSCRIKYRNSNGTYNFYGAHYRLIGITGNIIVSGKTDKNGITNLIAKAYEGTKIYLELKNIATGKWESPHPLKRLSFIARKSTPRYSVIVTNLYFKMKLINTKGVPLKWRYYMIFKDKEGRSFTRSGSFDKKGESNYISYETINPKNHKEIFVNKSESNKLDVEVKIIPPEIKMVIPTAWLRLIPVGADKSFRTHPLAVTTDTTKELTKESLTKLKDMAEYRKVLLDIDLQSGASYTIERAKKGYLYDKDLAETTKITFQNNESRQIYVPKNYYGKLLLKKSGELVATLSIAEIDSNKKNIPIVFCLSNKSKAGSNGKVSVNDISKTESMVWHLESKTSIAKGQYNIDREDISDNEFIVLKSVLSSLAFDGLVLPGVTETQNILKNNNRQFIWDALRKLEVGVSKINNENVYTKAILRFDVKKINMKGVTKTVIVFKGYSGHRSFLRKEFYPLAKSKVGMLSAASNVKAAVKAGGYGAGGLAAVKSTARGLGPFGIGLVATFDIVEFLLTDNWENNFSDLYVTLGIDMGKAAIATFAGVVASAAVVGLGIGIVVVGVGIGAAILTSLALEAADRKFNITQKSQNMVNYLESSNLKYLEANKSL